MNPAYIKTRKALLRNLARRGLAGHTGPEMVMAMVETLIDLRKAENKETEDAR
jgi:hypothetical protein